MRFLNKKMNKDIYNKFMLFLGMFCIVLGISVLLSQIGLRIDATRNMLTSADILDGAIAAGVEGLTDTGTITLEITDGKPSEKILILINGNEEDSFTEAKKDIIITSQSVIEIKNTTKKLVKVKLSSVSENLDAVLNNEEIEVVGTKVLCRVIFSK